MAVLKEREQKILNYMKEEIKQIVNFKCYRNEKNKEKEVFLDSDVHDTCSALNILRVSGHIGNGR